jgi:hypothetical protein
MLIAGIDGPTVVARSRGLHEKYFWLEGLDTTPTWQMPLGWDSTNVHNALSSGQRQIIHVARYFSSWKPIFTTTIDWGLKR